MQGGIYKILNITTGLFYLGSTTNFKTRWYNHRLELIGNRHKNSYLQNAWNKYGEIAFEFIILEYCEYWLVQKEQKWLDKTKCYERHIGYNLSPSAYSSKGIKRSEEYKKKMSAIFKGRSMSEEQKIKISNTLKGRKLSEEHKRQLLNAAIGNKSNTGRKLSEEHRLKISKGGKGKKRSIETKARMSLAFTGRICSEETKLKISIAAKKRFNATTSRMAECI